MGSMGNLGKLFVFVGGCLGNYYSAEQAFVSNRVVPDLVSYPPKNGLGLFFPSGAIATQGNVLLVSQLTQPPSLAWQANPSSYYTVIAADPDAPSRTNPEERSFLHWMVINIPATNIKAGETIFDYVPPGPPPKTGLHRYAFLVYEQPTKICYNGPKEFEDRAKFSVDWFAAQYNLGCPFAGNFFLTQNEDN